MRARILLSSVALAGVAMPFAVRAQTAAPAPAEAQADPAAGGEIVVTGIRQSLQSALNEKRNASVILDAISAEDVGKFPDTNVAESLQRVPGVSVDHNFGDGERVSILGTDPSLNRTLLNGQTIASVGWYTQDTPSRTFNYALLAPEVVSRAEVYRSSVASIEEGSIGGTVIVRTRRPLDLKAGLVQGSLGVTYNDRADKADVNGSALFNWHNDAKTVGIILAYQHFSQSLRRDGIETSGTTTGAAYLNAANSKLANGQTFPHVVTAVGPNSAAIGPSSLGSAYFNQDRTRDGGNIGLQFRPVEGLEIDFDGLYTREKFDNVNQSLYGYNTTQPGAVTALTAQDGILTRGTFADVAPADCGTRATRCVGISNLPLYIRESTVKTYALDLRGSYSFGDGWNLALEGGRTRATGGTDHQLSGTFQARGGYTYDVSAAPDSAPTLVFTDPTQATNPAKWRLASVSDVKLPYTDEENYGQVDLVKRFEGDSPVRAVRVGAKYKAHETTQMMLRKSLTLPTSSTVDASTIGTVMTPGDFLAGIPGTSADETDHILIDIDQFAAYMGTLSLGDYLPVQASDFDVREKITNGYAQLDYDWNGLRGNVGLRYAHTQQTSNGFEVSSSGTVATPVSYRRSYDNWLPSLSLSYDLDRQLVARFSAAQVISRAGFGNLSSYFRLSDNNLTGTGGNPNLDPYKSNNFDLSLEWYFARNSYLSVSGFYRDIKNYILNIALPEERYNSTLGIISTYSVSRPQNAGAATSKGLTVAYQQQLPAGFGLTANYTFVDASARDGSALPYASRHQVSFSPFFESGPFSLRGSLTWRSRYFTGVDANTNLFTRAFTQLDASASYAINRNVQLQLSASNLLDSTYYNYADREQLVRGIYKNGRRLLATARLKF